MWKYTKNSHKIVERERVSLTFGFKFRELITLKTRIKISKIYITKRDSAI